MPAEVICSVVVPLYNKAGYVTRAIESVLAQTVQDFEIVVVDDGSTDDGAEVARQIGDDRIRVVRQENQGVSVARNVGMAESSCEDVAFLDADDEWRPHFLETVLGLRTRYPQAGLYGTAYSQCRDGTIHHPHFRHCVTDHEGGLIPDYFLAAAHATPIWMSAVMVPKWVVRELGGFPAGIRRGEDVYFVERIAVRYPIAWSPVEGAVYHLSAANRATSFRLPSDVPPPSAIEEFLTAGGEPVSSRQVMETFLARRRLNVALDLHLHGLTERAKQMVAKTEGVPGVSQRRMLVKAALQFSPITVRTAKWARRKVLGAQTPSAAQ